MKNILVMCRQNACRSIMAEGIINGLYADKLKAVSAGSEPVAAVHPKVVATLTHHQIDCSRLHSKSWDDFLEQHFDAVITVCNSANKACPRFPGEYARLHWHTPDPAKFEGTAADVDKAFADTFALLKARIESELL